jgi:hypothetical protein
MPVCFKNQWYRLAGRWGGVAESGVRASELALTCLVGAAGGMVLPAAAVEIVKTELAALPDAHGFAGCFAGLSGGRLLVAGGANFPDGVMPWDGGKKTWPRITQLRLTGP